MFKIIILTILLFFITIKIIPNQTNHEKQMVIYAGERINLSNYLQYDENNNFVENTYNLTAEDNRYRALKKNMILFSSTKKSDMIAFLNELINFSEIPNDEIKYYKEYKLSKYGKYNMIWVGSGFYSFTNQEFKNILKTFQNKD